MDEGREAVQGIVAALDGATQQAKEGHRGPGSGNFPPLVWPATVTLADVSYRSKCIEAITRQYEDAMEAERARVERCSRQAEYAERARLFRGLISWAGQIDRECLLDIFVEMHEDALPKPEAQIDEDILMKTVGRTIRNAMSDIDDRLDEVESAARQVESAVDDLRDTIPDESDLTSDVCYAITSTNVIRFD